MTDGILVIIDHIFKNIWTNFSCFQNAKWWYWNNHCMTSQSVKLVNSSNVYDIVTIDIIRAIFLEMFKQRGQVLIETASSRSTLTNIGIEKRSADITKNNEKIIQFSKKILMSKWVLIPLNESWKRNGKRERRNFKK